MRDTWFYKNILINCHQKLNRKCHGAGTCAATDGAFKQRAKEFDTHCATRNTSDDHKRQRYQLNEGKQNRQSGALDPHGTVERQEKTAQVGDGGQDALPGAQCLHEGHEARQETKAQDEEETAECIEQGKLPRSDQQHRHVEQGNAHAKCAEAEANHKTHDPL